MQGKSIQDRNICLEEFANVYLMLPSKTTKVCLDKRISYNQLRFQIKKLFGIHEDCQILYYKGQLLDVDSMKELTQNTIIHVEDNRRKVEQTMTVHLIQYISDGQNLFKATKLKLDIEVNSKDLVGSSLRSGMAEKGLSQNFDDWSFISSGRFLNKNKSFMEQNVLDNHIIELILSSKEQSHKLIFSSFSSQKNDVFISSQSKDKKEQERIYFQVYKNTNLKESNITQSQSIIQYDIVKNIQQNPQSQIKEPQSATSKQPEEDTPVLRKIKSAKTLTNNDKYRGSQPPPMKFSLANYKTQIALQRQTKTNLIGKETLIKSPQTKFKTMKSVAKQVMSPKPKVVLKRSQAVLI